MQEAKLQEFINQYEICDGHGHIFPEKIAAKAVSSIGDFYGIPMFSGEGVSDAILKSGSQIGVTHYLVCSAATTAHQVESINQFIVHEYAAHPEFVGFGTLHPDYKDVETQIQFCLDNGLRGIKLHPDFQRFNIDDKRAYKIYECAAGKLPILFHTGDNRYDFSSPTRLKKVVSDFPDLVAFASHFGGYQRWDEAASCLAGEKNVYYDTSSSLPFISAEKARELVRVFGTEKLFFGSDFPMWQHREELERFMNLNLSESQNRAILSENFKQFFHL